MDPDYDALTAALGLEADRLRHRADYALWAAERANAELEAQNSVQAECAMHRAASAYARAASYWSLVDLERAMSLYVRATELYRNAGRTFANVTSICSGRPTEVLFWADEQAVEPPDLEWEPEWFVQFLLGSTFGEVVGKKPSDRIASMLDHFSQGGRAPQRLGRLGIPMELYLDVIRAARGVAFDTGQRAAAWETDAAKESQRLEVLAEALVAFLLRAEEVLARAMTDTYHWSSCRSSLLPAEPEVVAPTTLAATAALDRSLDRTLATLIEERLPERARVPLELGLGIARAMTVGA